jgi:Kef-type K+ transport system membrane component KefB
MGDTTFYEIATLLLVAAVIGLLGTVLRQPVVVSFIAVGIVAATLFQTTPETVAQIDFFAELGVTLLLFLVGLKLDWRLVRALGPVALATGLGQVGFTSVFGFLICLGLGLDVVTSIYVAVALTFSSTIIIVKLLTDKRELETLHGRIALGFLIVQDIVVVIAMAVLSTLGIGAASETGVAGSIVGIVAGLVAVVVVLAVFVRYLADPLMARFAKTPELVVIFAIGWAAAAAAVGDMIGLGKELGGLAAGMSLGSTQFRDMISARMAALRDFLLLFFFLSVGATFDITELGGELWGALVLSVFVLIGNPLIVVLIMSWMGYTARTGFLAGLTVAQISEFSLIFMAMGLSLGHIDSSAVGLVTLVGLVTIATSVYMITYSQQLYEWTRPLLKPFEFGHRRESNTHGAEPGEPVDIIVFGLGRFGGHLLKQLTDAGFQVLGIDLDPVTVREWKSQGYAVRYGDVTEPEFWSELPLTQARWIVLAVPYGTSRLTETDPHGGLIMALKTHQFQGRVAITARDDEEGRILAEGGVDLVLYPFDDAAASAASQISDLDYAARSAPNLHEPAGH